MRATLLCLLSLTSLALHSAPADAKDLRRRPAIGFQLPAGPFPALSVRYGLPTPDPVINIQGELLVGFGIGGGQANDGLHVGARALYGFVAEDNLNLYAAFGVGWIGTDALKAVRLTPGLGAEFFFFGLENLGFSADVGLAIDLGTPTRLDTFVAGPGVHYYF